MTTFQVPDEDGHTITLKRIHKGRFSSPVFPSSGTERMSETPLRPDDVLLVSYPKSGCHWVWENVRLIMEGDIKNDDIHKNEYMMDLFEFGYFDSFPSPRILNNHACFDDQPTDLLKGNVKVIFLYRNPKDVAVSYYHHTRASVPLNYDGNFRAYLKLFAEGKVPYNFFEYIQSWDQGLKANPQIPCLFVRYEDLHSNPLAERRRLAEFLGKKRDDAFLNEVIKATTIERMKENKENATVTGKDGTPFMYRKGKIGDWKNHFCVSDNEWFDEVLKEKLGDLHLIDFVYE